jgi:hypothetical protein
VPCINPTVFIRSIGKMTTTYNERGIVHDCYQSGIYDRNAFHAYQQQRVGLDFRTHEDQGYFNQNGFVKIDGRVNDKKLQQNPPQQHQRPRRREELVSPKSPLKPTASQPPPVVRGRRDEMVTAGSRGPIVSEPPAGGHQYRSRRRDHEDAGHNRKRSVSPQMRSNRPSHHVVTTKPDPLAESLPYQIAATPQMSPSYYGATPTSPSKQKRHKQKLDMSDHDNRCKTFELDPKWPHSRIHYIFLASIGLYFTGFDDVVQCHDCPVRLYDWTLAHDPLRRHFHDSPNCRFLRREYHDEIEEICQEDFRSYADVNCRRISFHNWPIPRQLNGDELANAGWFYTGKDVNTQCFNCGCLCTDWRKGDDPWIKHKELSSNKCSFIWKSSCELPHPPIIDFSSYQARLDSFKLLPKGFPVDKESFAQAGFHLIGTNPVRAKCWSCELMMDWSRINKDPLDYHYRMNPNCNHFLHSSEDYQPESPSKMQPETMEYTKGSHFHSPSPTTPSNNKINNETSFSRRQLSKELSSESGSYRSENGSLPTTPRTNTRTPQPSYKSLPAQMNNSQFSFSPHPSSSDLPEEDDSLCIICYDNPKEYAIVPCGHLCVCDTCVKQLSHCPICRVPKQNVLRIFNT